MALSRSIQKGQSALTCQLCEETHEIKWKCIHCDLLICTKCRKFHMKIKSSEKHEIVDLKDIADYKRETEPTQDSKEIKCETHDGQMCCLYCKTCDEFVCVLCITQIHNQHPMIDLDEGHNLFLSKLRDMSVSTATQFEFDVIKCYRTSLSYVNLVVCGSSSSLWISNFGSRELQNLKPSMGSHSHFYVCKRVSLPVNNILRLPSMDRLLSTSEPNLHVLSHKTGDVQKSKFSVAPLITTSALHLTDDNKILVGARERGPNFPANGPRQIILMNTDGLHEHVYQFDKNLKELFTLPYKISTDKNKMMYVIDKLSPGGHGRLMILDQNGGIKTTYTGHSSINRKGQIFNPMDLVVTNMGNIIVSEKDKHIIHVINNEGQCLRYWNTLDFGINFPWSLDIDNMGMLYIGCDSCKDKPDEAPIYIVKTSGF